MRRFVLLISLLFGSVTAFGGLVNAVSIVVDGEPITLYEIYKTTKETRLPKEKAVEYLIKERLKDKELKRLAIVVDDFDVNQEIERIANQNGINSLELRTILANKGIDWDKYKQNIRKKLKEQQLYQRILSTKIEQPSQERLKEYYQIHKDEFFIPEAINLIQYFAPNKQALEQIMQNPLANVAGVTQQMQTIPSKKLDQQLLFMLTKTPKGEFTQIIPTAKGFTTFFVQGFVNQSLIPFDDIKEHIYAKWMEEKQKEAIESHFEKMRAIANIKVLRVP